MALILIHLLEQQNLYDYKVNNIAGRLPEDSGNSFVDLQSKKNSKKDRPKKSSFH